MECYCCQVCGWKYNPTDGLPDEGIEPGTLWQDIPDDKLTVCPDCGADREGNFEPCECE